MGAGGGLAGCHACIKYLMFAFNFIFWLIGCGLVGLGIWILVDENFRKLIANGEANFQFLEYAGIVLCVVGGIIMVVGFFGCCGAIRESQCLLVMFFICMLLLFMALVAAGVASLVFKDEVIKKAQEASTGDLKKLMQELFKCCAVNDLTDVSGCSHLEACTSAIEREFKDKIAIVAGVTLGSGVLMLLGMIFSMMLCCAIRDQE